MRRYVEILTRVRCSRSRVTVAVYAALFAVAVLSLVSMATRGVTGADPLVVATLTGVTLCAYLAEEGVRDRLPATLDTTLALALITVAVAGAPLAFGIMLLPEAIRLVRRRGAYWNSGLLANVVSYAAEVLSAAGILAIVRAHGGLDLVGALLLAGAAMAAANYFFARLMLAVLRDRAPALALIRREFAALLPLELAMIAVAALTSLLLLTVGPVALAGFALLVYVPQVGVELLLRAPSVAALSVDAAAAVYRAALCDELGLSRADRRSIEQTDALVQRRRLPGDGGENPLRLMQDALLVSVCSETMPSQPAFTASVRAQVVLTARRWAQLTARCTPALNHSEALEELHRGSIAHDAPRALAAAARIADRESALTEHVAGVPRLHRAPLPRRARQQLLPQALTRLAG